MAVFSVGSSGDDANEVQSSGAVSTTLDGTTTGARLDGTNHAGFRFTNVTIANAATISSATLTFTQLNAYSFIGGNLAQTTFYGHNADNPINFGVGTSDISARARTTASATGGPDDTSFSVTATSIVQEIVNRAGWASGNAMVMLAIGTGTTDTKYIQPYMWDYFSGTYYAQLTITTGSGVAKHNLTLLGIGK